MTRIRPSSDPVATMSGVSATSVSTDAGCLRHARLRVSDWQRCFQSRRLTHPGIRSMQSPQPFALSHTLRTPSCDPTILFVPLETFRCQVPAVRHGLMYALPFDRNNGQELVVLILGDCQWLGRVPPHIDDAQGSVAAGVAMSIIDFDSSNTRASRGRNKLLLLVHEHEVGNVFPMMPVLADRPPFPVVPDLAGGRETRLRPRKMRRNALLSPPHRPRSRTCWQSNWLSG